MKQRTSSVSSLSLFRNLLQRYVHDENARSASIEVAGLSASSDAHCLSSTLFFLCSATVITYSKIVDELYYQMKWNSGVFASMPLLLVAISLREEYILVLDSK